MIPPPSVFARVRPLCSLARKLEVEDWLWMLVSVMAATGDTWRQVTNEEIVAVFPKKAEFFAAMEGYPAQAGYLDHARHLLREHAPADISPIWAERQDQWLQSHS